MVEGWDAVPDACWPPPLAFAPAWPLSGFNLCGLIDNKRPREAAARRTFWPGGPQPGDVCFHDAVIRGRGKWPTQSRLLLGDLLSWQLLPA